MPWKFIAWMIFSAGLLAGQDGQRPVSQPGWPCVPGRPADPAYLETSESTGGQLFLFQRSEAAKGMAVLTATQTHPSTVLRALGNLSGDREFEFPVDSTMTSILLMASLQCRNAIRVYRPGGAEATESTSVQYLEFQAGRIQRIDLPEPGVWKVRLTGTGLFVLSVLTKAGVLLSQVSVTGGHLQARLGGEAGNVKFQVVDAAGVPVADLDATETDGVWRAAVEPPVGRFRIRVTGTDSGAWPFQRTHPILYRAQPPK